jgi:Na+-driven multidrug efflux pump
MASGAYNLEEFVRILDSWGLTDVMLPFLLIFVVMFALLTKARILGEDKRRFNLIIALVLALLVVIPHVLDVYPEGGDVVEIMNNALPQVSLIAVAVIMLLLLIGLFGGEAKWMGSSMSGWIAIVAFIIILVIFGGAAGWWGNWSWFYDFFGGETIAIIIMILVFAVIVWWITRGEGKEKELNALSNVGKWVGEMFGGGK